MPVISLSIAPVPWLQKMLMCSEPDLEISQCAAQIWALGSNPKAGSRGRVPGGRLGGAKPPGNFWYDRDPYTI